MAAPPFSHTQQRLGSFACLQGYVFSSHMTLPVPLILFCTLQGDPAHVMALEVKKEAHF